MCGIIGYLGEEEVIPILIDGLKKLEYRGYDSAGLSIRTKEIKLVKNKGKIRALESKPKIKKLSGSVGIAHTRWATHGSPNEINSHPHLDCKKDLAIVHNGIIENFQSLKSLLKQEGHKFRSETDSEILAHLIEKFYTDNLEVAVSKALNLVEGTFGVAVIHKKEKKIVAARRSSPLIVGIGETGMFIASDVPAILKYTRRVIYLDDNEMAILTPNKYKIIKLNGKHITKKIHNIKWEVNQIEKKDFKHFMLKEIFEQPISIANTLRGRVKNNIIKLTLDLDIKSINKILITACGTSWHAGLIGKRFIEQFTKIPVEVDYASELRYRNPLVDDKTLLIVISQSGETADTLAALALAKSKGAKTIGLVNVVGSTIAREVDSGIYLHAGPEIGVASTKAFTSQVVTLMILSLYLRQELGQELEKNILSELKNLPFKIKDALKFEEEIKEVAKLFKNSINCLYLGRGINFPVALEGALKLKEISYIHAEGYPAAEMKHGPIALIDENMPVVFLATKDKLSKKILGNMEEVKARKGKIIAVIHEDDEVVKDLAEHTIKVPKTLPELSPILNVIPLQLLAYHIADGKGIDVDKPRNLAKSVTVE